MKFNYHYCWLFHRFVHASDCLPSIEDLKRFGGYCDGSSLYNGWGNILKEYSDPTTCREKLKTLPNTRGGGFH